MKKKPIPKHLNCNASLNMYFGYDRFTVSINRDELSLSISEIEADGTKVVFDERPMQFHPTWKLKAQFHQPSRAALKTLKAALTGQYLLLLTYVEITCDILFESKVEARRFQREFLAAAQMKSQRKDVKFFKTCWYYGRRTKGDGKAGNTLAVYADKPSKLNVSGKPSHMSYCLHIEWRVSGSNALENIGLVSIDDLIEFNHQKFWNEHVRFYVPPKKKYELGLLLRSAAGKTSIVSKAKLRSRVDRWTRKHSLVGNFVMHNALLGNPRLAKKLPIVPFIDWFKARLRPAVQSKSSKSAANRLPPRKPR